MRIREILLGEATPPIAANYNAIDVDDRHVLDGVSRQPAEPVTPDYNMPKMYVDLSDVDPNAEFPFDPIKQKWPMGGFNDQSYVMSNPGRDPRHRGKGVANDNPWLGLIPPVKPR